MIAEQLAAEGRLHRERTFAAGQPMTPIVIASRGPIRLWAQLGRSAPGLATIESVGGALITIGCGMRADRVALVVDGVLWEGIGEHPPTIDASRAAGARDAIFLADATRGGDRELASQPYVICAHCAEVHWLEDPRPLATAGGWTVGALDQALAPDGFDRFAELLGEGWWSAAATPDYRDAMTDLSVGRYLVDRGHTCRIFGAGAHVVLAERHETFIHSRLSVRLA